MSDAAPRPIRLLIVDDHEMVREGLKAMLVSEPDFSIVGDAANAEQALTLIERLRPDIALLDIRLPGTSGIEVCRRIQKLEVETKVLVLTSYADDDLIFDAIAAGADGYLLKEINAESLVRAIHEVAEGKSVLDPIVTRRVMSRAGKPGESQNKLDLLSAQERRVVKLVSEGKTNKEIAVEMGLSDKTVKNYLSNALDKLELSRRSQAAALFVTENLDAKSKGY